MAATLKYTREGMKPRAEQMVGEVVTILGVKAQVVDVVPQDDWHWLVTLESLNAGDRIESWSIVLPTDYRTDNGQSAWA